MKNPKKSCGDCAGESLEHPKVSLSPEPSKEVYWIMFPGGGILQSRDPGKPLVKMTIAPYHLTNYIEKKRTHKKLDS